MRFLAFITLVLTLPSGALLAQENPYLGTWKLNPAKSKYTGVPAPKTETRAVTPEGKGVKISFEGIAADGSRIAYSFSANGDGKPMPVTGEGIPGGADSFAVGPMTSRTNTTTWFRAGKEVGKSQTVVSKDGKESTITRKGTDASGKAISAVTVWDKQ